VANVLGAKIKELRKEKALTLEQLAEKIGSGKSYIWEIENKGVKRPSAEKLAAIAKALDVTTDYLIDDTQTEVSDDLEKEVF
ncbi:XRE family transcriptional regulator, partial [methanotrophic bacterial endosymbiont of Bathymodiolus sp.]